MNESSQPKIIKQDHVSFVDKVDNYSFEASIVPTNKSMIAPKKIEEFKKSGGISMESNYEEEEEEFSQRSGLSRTEISETINAYQYLISNELICNLGKWDDH